MKTIRIVAPRETEIVQIEEPKVDGPNDVKIQVLFAGVCPDDLPFFRQDIDMLGWGPILYPGNGHEMSGIIVDLGQSAKEVGFKVGMRVSGYAWNQCGQCYYCLNGNESHCLNLRPTQSTMSEYIVWHSRQLIKIPDNVSSQSACLTDPIGHSLRGIDRSKLRIGQSVLIIGGIVPGLILVQLAKICGASQITLVEPNKANRDLAVNLGANLCIDSYDPSLSAKALLPTDMLGYDVVFETSGKLDMLTLASTLLGREGVLAYSSIYGLAHKFPIKISELFIKEACLIPFHMAPYMLPKIQKLIGKLTLQPLISEVFSMEDATNAYLAVETGQFPHILIKIAK